MWERISLYNVLITKNLNLQISMCYVIENFVNELCNDILKFHRYTYNMCLKVSLTLKPEHSHKCTQILKYDQLFNHRKCLSCCPLKSDQQVRPSI